MTNEQFEVIAGIDTHADTHHVALITDYGKRLGDRKFLAVGSGYQEIAAYLTSFGPVTAVGVEGTGSYGAELTRVLAGHGFTFELPIQSSTTVTHLEVGATGSFSIRTDTGYFASDRVIVATGVQQVPTIPAFADQISVSTTQLHSSNYRNPSMISDGPVAVVEFGTSGAQIACDLAASHSVVLCGSPTPHVPDVVLRYAPSLYWLLIHHILTRSTPVGRMVAKTFFTKGAPLIGISADDIDEAGIIRAEKIDGVRDGNMVTRNGAVIEACTVIWATGYHPDFSWIQGVEVDEAGYPFHERGISSQVPGLGFLGIPFQYGLTSGLIGGAGRDAIYLARRLQHLEATATSGSALPEDIGNASLND
ncbi:NAD(P)-binding domain-containing protein [Arthrobacter sp. H35-D1]|uniref:NAD(P)-binding domain-containing protein n=1 Tax=Arthrobacter sp. H35-D1 TaxID=3046202 RepID=UPI0024BBDD1A|nr:NAD(P)-binding domain-containing protein [Arthrobacter sp. H35-D1]MDJ0314623.1 NAD(P)-binding domain-containing protein [Arthrobacter sp. H35-D1]